LEPGGIASEDFHPMRKWSAGESQQDSPPRTFAACETGLPQRLPMLIPADRAAYSISRIYSLGIELLLLGDLAAGAPVTAMSCYLGSEHHGISPHRGLELPLLCAPPPGTRSWL